MSGRLSCESKLSRIPSIVKEGTITASEVAELESEYRKLSSAYSNLVLEYERAKKAAAVKRCLSTFPSRDIWTPPTRTLSQAERKMIAGPTNEVVFLRKLVLQNQSTGRYVEYSTSEFERDGRVANSYAAIVKGSNQPSFVQIKKLFEHSFLDTTHDWAIVVIFKSTHLDEEFNLWNVSLNETEQKCVLLTHLTQPLAVARDINTKLWFLNFNKQL